MTTVEASSCWTLSRTSSGRQRFRPSMGKITFSAIVPFSILLLTGSFPFCSCSSILNAALRNVQRAYNGARSSGTLENLGASVSHLLRGGKGGPTLHILNRELDGLGLGAECLVEKASRLEANQAEFLLAVAANTHGVRKFISKFGIGGGDLPSSTAAGLMKHQIQLLSGAIQLPSNEGRAEFLASEVSSIRPAFMALSREFADALTAHKVRVIGKFVKTELPLIREYLRLLLKLMEGETSSTVLLKRLIVSNWIRYWFAQDLSLLSVCPNSSKAEVEARRNILNHHDDKTG